MSVTFFCPDVPTVQVAPFEDEPEYLVNEPLEPFFEVNLANSNAQCFLDLLNGDDAESVGQWDVEKVGEVFNRLTTLSHAARNCWPTPEINKLLDWGLRLDYVGDVAARLARLAHVAKEHGKPICYG